MPSMRLKIVYTLLKKDALLEFRQQYTFFGILLYIASTTFVIYLTMGQPDDHVWNGLFWVTLLFICINTVILNMVIIYFSNCSISINYIVII